MSAGGEINCRLWRRPFRDLAIFLCVFTGLFRFRPTDVGEVVLLPHFEQILSQTLHFTSLACLSRPLLWPGFPQFRHLTRCCSLSACLYEDIVAALWLWRVACDRLPAPLASINLIVSSRVMSWRCVPVNLAGCDCRKDLY